MSANPPPPTSPGRLFLRVELEGGRLGPGKIGLLEHIRRERSLAAAARAMGMSYKRAWDLMSTLNEMFDEPVAVTHPGRNVACATELTPFGERLASELPHARLVVLERCGHNVMIERAGTYEQLIEEFLSK